MEVGGGRVRPAWWGELVAVAFLLVLYDRVADLAHPRVRGAVERGLDVLRLESRLHLDVERRVNHLAAAHHTLGQALSLYYDLAHGIVAITVLVAGWAWGCAAYRRARRALVAVNLGALAVFLAVPVAPPRLLPGAGFVDVVAASGTWGAVTATSAVARHANEYASLPSLHVAWAVWVVFAVRAWTSGRGWQALAAAHLLLTVAVVVLTGNHYLLDVVAGGGLTAGAWHLAGRLGCRAPAALPARAPATA